MVSIPRPRKRPKPDFSLAVINIVFLLLLFYLVTGSLMRPEEMQADAPVTSELKPDLLPRPLLVVAADGTLLLDGVSVDRAALGVAAQGAVGEGGVLNVLADRSMAGRAFLELLAQLDAGGVPLRIVSLRSDTGREP